MIAPNPNSRPRLAPRFGAPATDEADWEPSIRPLDLGLIRWIGGYTRPYARKRNTLLCMVCIRAIQLPAIAWAIGTIINGPIGHGSVAGLAWSVAGLLLLCVSTQCVLHFRQRFALELGEVVVHDLRRDLFAQLQRMRMSFFNQTKLGRIISRMTSDIEAVRAGVQDVLFTSLVGLGQMIVASAVMLYTDRVLFAVVAVLVPVLWGVNRYFRDRLSRVHRELHESFSRVTSTLAESVNGIHVTQGFVRQETNSRLFRELVAHHSGFSLEAARIGGLLQPLLEVNSQIFLVLLLTVGGYRVLAPGDPMPLGSLVQFFFLANIFFGPVQTLGDQYNQALVAMAGAERVRELLGRQPEWSDPPHALRPKQLAGCVEFHRVTFAYDAGRPVLHDVSFSASPGETVALVGHTGSGKSSIIQLVAKFYLPTAGRLTIDGHDILDLDTDWLHSQMGIVLQQNFLFSGTVLDNIRLARPTASDAEVAAAAAELDCLDLLECLPEGLHTEVGENGNRLSLGQRQLVCFARSLLADPRILILDEATSSVDVFTEQRIQHALKRLLEGRTALVVAHRLSTIRDASLVLVLEHGRVVERGRHPDLVERDGVYAGLHREFTRLSAA